MANNCCNFAERIEIYLNFGYEKVCFCEEVHFHFYLFEDNRMVKKQSN